MKLSELKSKLGLAANATEAQVNTALEAAVSKAEAEIAETETALGNFVSVDETVRLNDLLISRRAALETLLAEWEELVQSIEANA